MSEGAGFFSYLHCYTLSAICVAVVGYYCSMFFLRFVTIIFSKAFYIVRTRKKEARWCAGFVKSIEAKFDGRLDDFTFKKVVNSYAIYNPMMCDAFMQLHNRNTSREERERLVHYFICSSLFDNFCDRKELTAEQLYQISFQPNSFRAASVDEKMFLHSHLFLRNYVKDKVAYDQVSYNLFCAQQASARQFDKGITNEEIEDITLKKGGYSVQLCHFYFDDKATAAEIDCWYRIGGIIQMTNDLFDIYKDLQEGSQTLPVRMKDAHAFKQLFLEMIAGVKKQISLMDISQRQRESFTVSMMGICAFGLIALQQLQTLQGSNKELPNFTLLPRKALIVDMEKPVNLWRWIRLVYQHSKTL